MDTSSIARTAVEQELAKVLSSAGFVRADRSSALLKYIVEQTLNGQGDRLKEYTLGAVALGRGNNFDPRTDPVVRAEASRLRARLEQYYDTDGHDDLVQISLPKGGYVPQFERRTPTSVTHSNKQGLVGYNVSSLIAWVCTGIALTLAVITWTYRGDSSNTVRESIQQFEVELKSDGDLGSLVSNDIVISPDGQRIVFVSRAKDGLSHLNTRRLDQSNSVSLVGTEGARIPFFSPDGRWVGFTAEGKLKKVSLDGGSPVILCDATDVFGASWGEDDTIVAAIGLSKVLSRIPAAGGAPEPVIHAADDSVLLRWPQILPDGQAVLYSASTGGGADRARIEVQSIRGGDRKVLTDGGTFARYLSSGHLVYVNQGTLFAARFDLKSLSIIGTSVPVLDDVSYSTTFGYAQFDVSSTGTLVYRKGAEATPSTVHWIERGGKTTPFLEKPARYSWMRLSPDDKQLAVTVVDSGARNIMLYDAASKVSKKLNSVAGEYAGYVWVGPTLIHGNVDGIYSINLSEPLTSTRLTDQKRVYVPWSLSPSHKRLAFYDRTPENGFNLWTAPIIVDGINLKLGRSEPYLNTPAFEFYPSFSPDGRWMAYSSDESGVLEVYVRRFPDTGYKVKLSVGGGSQLRWSPNNREVLYRTVERQVMTVNYRIDGDRFIPDSPKLWSSHILANAGIAPNYDIASDGERIVAALPSLSPESQSPNHATFILNFYEEIRRKFAGSASVK